jgi:predicted O-linked N-acetylglucosamine transferase (SPINDLY family)
MATSPSLLEDARARVARARDQSALFDSMRFTRSLEDLYANLIRDHGA